MSIQGNNLTVPYNYETTATNATIKHVQDIDYIGLAFSLNPKQLQSITTVRNSLPGPLSSPPGGPLRTIGALQKTTILSALITSKFLYSID
jgi:hypothetical protein